MFHNFLKFLFCNFFSLPCFPVALLSYSQRSIPYVWTHQTCYLASSPALRSDLKKNCALEYSPSLLKCCTVSINLSHFNTTRYYFCHGLKLTADSVSLVQCFGTLCRLYLIKIVFRIFLGGYFVGVKLIILMEGVT